jgi:hypothetical protein
MAFVTYFVADSPSNKIIQGVADRSQPRFVEFAVVGN